MSQGVPHMLILVIYEPQERSGLIPTEDSTEEHITVIPVPNYNKRKDELTVIRDNHLLVYDVDYTIETFAEIRLLIVDYH